MKFLSNAIDLLNYAYLVFSIDNCINSKALPGQMHTLLPSLQVLSIRFCPELGVISRRGFAIQFKFTSNLFLWKTYRQPLGFGVNLKFQNTFQRGSCCPRLLRPLKFGIILFRNLWMVISFTFIGDWLLPKSSFHARRGSANISMFPECQEMSKTGPR